MRRRHESLPTSRMALLLRLPWCGSGDHVVAAMNRAQDFDLRLRVFEMLKASDVVLADLQERLVKADSRIEADCLRTSINRVRAARASLEMVA